MPESCLSRLGIVFWPVKDFAALLPSEGSSAAAPALGQTSVRAGHLASPPNRSTSQARQRSTSAGRSVRRSLDMSGVGPNRAPDSGSHAGSKRQASPVRGRATLVGPRYHTSWTGCAATVLRQYPSQ